MSYQIKDNPNFDLNEFERIAISIKDEFKEKTKDIVFQNGGIGFSEGLAICTLCIMYDVDILIESGRGFGISTEMFARFFDGKNLKIYSIDLSSNKYINPDVWAKACRGYELVKKRLNKYEIELIEGDGCKIVPELVNNLKENHRIGLFIDGPKNQAQLDLAEKVFQMSDKVYFSALDDVGPRFGPIYDLFYQWPYSVFETTQDWYTTRFLDLNQSYEKTDLREWKKYMKRYKNTHGLGISVNFKTK